MGPCGCDMQAQFSGDKDDDFQSAPINGENEES